MKLILLCTAMISLAMLTFAQPKLPKRPGFGAGGSLLRLEPDYTGREAMRDEVILMPKGER